MTTATSPSRATAIYVRISSDPEGQRAGVQRQHDDCEALATSLGLTDLRVYEDNDRSAYKRTTRRPAFEQMIADVKAGEIGTVVIWAVDRLYRQVRDLEAIVPIFESAGVAIHAVKSGEIDVSTADGRLHARLLGSVAQHESEKKSERIKRSAEQRARSGRATASVRPLGWQWIDPCPGGEDECLHLPTRCEEGQTRKPRVGSKKGLEPHPVESRWLIDAYARIADGDSLRAVTRSLAAQGAVGATGKPLTSTSLRSALLMPRNGGMVGYKGEIVGETRDGIRLVDEGVWQVVVGVLTDEARRTSPESKVSTPLGGGLLTCGRCGGPMAASNKHYGKKKEPVYVCSRKRHLTRRRALLDGPVLDLARGLLVAMEQSGTLAVETRPDPEIEPLRAQIRALEDRLEAYRDDAADGEIDPADFAVISRKIRADIAERSNRLARQEGRPASARLLTAEGGVGEAFDALLAQAHEGTPDALRAVLREVFESVTVEEPAVPGHPTSNDVTVSWQAWVPASAPSRPVVDAGPVRLAQAERRAEVARLRAQGLGISAIADSLGVHRATVRGDLRVLV